MTARNIWIVVAGALWLCIVGVIGGVVIDRFHFTEHLDGATDNLNAQLATRAAPWEAPVRAVSEALARGDRGAAERAWRDAWSGALAARGWEGMAAAGDAALRMGEIGYARKAFLETLFRARAQRSVAGVLRAEEAFEALGDRAVAHQCLRVAETIPGIGDAERGLLRLRAARRIHSRVVERSAIGRDGTELAWMRLSTAGGSWE